MPDEFGRKYPPHPPELNQDQNTPSQLERLNLQTGLMILDVPPAVDVFFTDPPTYEKAHSNVALYLWVICPDIPGVLIANEKAPRAINPDRTRVCHTNLTGGADASGGGEMWFQDANTLLLNGCSGRYRLRCKGALDEAARVFARYGYKVGHMGMSKGTGKPRKCARPKDISWFLPETNTNREA